jgi:hypothetical protein
MEQSTMTMIYEKLAAWARLHRECEHMRHELRAIRTRGDQDPCVTNPREADYLALKARADAALHEASELLKARQGQGRAKMDAAGLQAGTASSGPP